MANCPKCGKYFDPLKGGCKCSRPHAQTYQYQNRPKQSQANRPASGNSRQINPLIFPDHYDTVWHDSQPMDKRLVDEWATSIAKQLTSKGGLTSTKARQYFGEARIIQQHYKNLCRIDSKQNAHKKIIPSLAVLRAKVAYDTGRDRNKMELYRQFIDKLTKLAEQSDSNFETAMVHFEAVIAFIKLYKPN